MDETFAALLWREIFDAPVGSQRLYRDQWYTKTDVEWSDVPYWIPSDGYSAPLRNVVLYELSVH